MTITIWCYKCGSKWHNRETVELYKGRFIRCPVQVKGPCNGYTDGVPTK